MKQNYEFFGSLSRWFTDRMERLESGYTMDLDSTVFVRYGEQEGSKKGYNTKKYGRNSHHPLISVYQNPISSLTAGSGAEIQLLPHLLSIL